MSEVFDLSLILHNKARQDCILGLFQSNSHPTYSHIWQFLFRLNNDLHILNGLAIIFLEFYGHLAENEVRIHVIILVFALTFRRVNFNLLFLFKLSTVFFLLLAKRFNWLIIWLFLCFWLQCHAFRATLNKIIEKCGERSLVT